MKKPTILLIGDNCLDIYYYGDVKRISPEAPIPVLDYVQKEQRYGMGANVWQNLEKLGCTVIFATSGRSIKTRFIDRNTNQHLLRLDEDPPREAARVPILHTGIHPWDAIAISDYEKGSVTKESIDYIKKHYKGPIFIDTKKKDLAQFEGMFVKINQKEYSEATSLPNEHLITTMGDLGASYKGTLYKAIKSDVCDPCGAGDTFFASLIYKYILSQNIEDSIKFANAASSITVKHVGVYSPTIEEIEKVYHE